MHRKAFLNNSCIMLLFVLFISHVNATETQATDAPGTQATDAPGTKPTDAPVTKPTDAPVTKPTDAPGTKATGAPGTQPTVTSTSKKTTKYIHHYNNFDDNYNNYGDKGYDNYQDNYGGDNVYNSGYAEPDEYRDNYENNNAYQQDYDKKDSYNDDYDKKDNYDSYSRNSGMSGYKGSHPDRSSSFNTGGGNNRNNRKGYHNSRYDNRESMAGSLEFWIRSADDWEQDSEKPRGRGRSGSKYNKNNKNKGYGKDEGHRKKRSSSRVSFPVRHFPDIRRFPLRRFPPLLSIFPWLPIFYDKLTYQTFIFSPTGGMYIIPPLINFYGQRFAVAQLIKWGYASLVSSGALPPPNVNIAPLVRPAPVGGPVTAGVVGSPAAGPAPAYDPQRARFTDGVKTDFPEFKPQYPKATYDGQNRNYNPSYPQAPQQRAGPYGY